MPTREGDGLSLSERLAQRGQERKTQTRDAIHAKKERVTGGFNDMIAPVRERASQMFDSAKQKLTSFKEAGSSFFKRLGEGTKKITDIVVGATTTPELFNAAIDFGKDKYAQIVEKKNNLIEQFTLKKELPLLEGEVRSVEAEILQLEQNTGDDESNAAQIEATLGDLRTVKTQLETQMAELQEGMELNETIRKLAEGELPKIERQLEMIGQEITGNEAAKGAIHHEIGEKRKYMALHKQRLGEVSDRFNNAKKRLLELGGNAEQLALSY
ncbi:MAG: hypothetical protein WC659_01535 [Patescibacteria group bacterium]